MIVQLLHRPKAVKVLKQARSAVQGKTPLKTNCGRLCHNACCQSDETGENGMLLFPFEETFYEKPIEGFPFKLIADDSLFKGGKRLVCQGQCLREHRPLACRIFPLRIAVMAENDALSVQAELDLRAYCVCPLTQQGGVRAMDKAFVEAVTDVGEILCQDTYMLEALFAEQDLMDEMRKL